MIKRVLINLFVCVILVFAYFFISLSINPKFHIYIQNLLKSSHVDAENIEKYNILFKNSNYCNITLYYTSEFEPALKLAEAYLDRARQDNIKLYGSIPIGELTVKFDYDEQIFIERNPMINDYTGLYFRADKTAYILVKDCYSNMLALNSNSSETRQTIIHEYTHHAYYEFLNLNQIPESKIPKWFMEGITEYISLKGENVLPPKKWVALSELSTQEQWAYYNNNDYDVYNLCYYAVKQLILTNGENVVKDILLKVKDKDFNSALYEAAGISLKDYEKALNDGYDNGWKKYSKINTPDRADFYTDIKIECLEKYIKLKSDNIDALLDLAELYKKSGRLGEERSTLIMALEKDPESTIAWENMALFYERMMDFDSAIEAFEKIIGMDEKSETAYSHLAQAFLTKDIGKALEAAQRAKNLHNSTYYSKQTQAILDYQSSIKSGKPYEGCLQLIKSGIINDRNIKKAIIEKVLRDYPDIKNTARNELETLNKNIFSK